LVNFSEGIHFRGICYFLVKYTWRVVSRLDFFACFDHSSTSLRSIVILSSYCDGPPLDHLWYSLRTVIVLCLLYSQCVLPCVHACSNITSSSNPTILAQENCEVALAWKVLQAQGYCTPYGRRTNRVRTDVGSGTSSTVVLVLHMQRG
jgi:hypothetical protein